MRRVLVLVGPTASGKTQVSLELARRMGAEIISADSRQIYRYMDIGTAKPTPEERLLIPHHFIDELTPDVEFNAGQYGKRGREVIEDIARRGHLPIVVGGSGLYIRALIDGIFEGPSADPELRKELYRRMKTEGPEKLLEELRTVDPESAARMLPANTRRIVRALEVERRTGTTISQLQKIPVEVNLTPVLAGLEWERAVLYGRIDRRVDSMVEQGLLEEVQHLHDLGYSSELNSLQTVGYREALQFLRNEVTMDEMVRRIKQNSRRYAKRQLTWFRHDRRIRWFTLNREEDLPGVAESIRTYFLSSATTENGMDAYV
jgi:tRNA dimethylallyltransferase